MRSRTGDYRYDHQSADWTDEEAGWHPTAEQYCLRGYDGNGSATPMRGNARRERNDFTFTEIAPLAQWLRHADARQSPQKTERFYFY